MFIHIITLYGPSRSLEYPRMLTIRKYHDRSAVCLLQLTRYYSHHALMHIRNVCNYNAVGKSRRIANFPRYRRILKHFGYELYTIFSHGLSVIVDLDKLRRFCLRLCCTLFQQELQTRPGIPEAPCGIDTWANEESQIVRGYLFFIFSAEPHESIKSRIPAILQALKGIFDKYPVLINEIHHIAVCCQSQDLEEFLYLSLIYATKPVQILYELAGYAGTT